jgi:phosphatidylserine/phosphatidylglycerophosphate/cardiolipin synthase-like enzyme
MNDKQSVVIANNDIVYLWWRVPKKIQDCLGFSIHRVIDGVEEEKGLYATVGFDVENDPRKSPQTTDEWPIQCFNWKDVYAPHDTDIQYKIIPMTGTWDSLHPDPTKTIVTQTVRRTQRYGDAKIIFNRGILATQAFAKSGTGKKFSPDEARDLISNPTSAWRKRLGGQLLYNIHAFFDRAVNEGGNYYAALYELTDDELIQEFTRNRNTELILSNANSSKTTIVDGKKKTITIEDGTNKSTRERLHQLRNITVYDRMLGSHIGHNKFVIYVDSNGKPVSVMMGSMNYTATGLCGQTNNLIIIESEKIASKYMEYWQHLKNDIPEKQGTALRTWCAEHCAIETMNQDTAKVTVWFSPNTKEKSKPKNAPTPVDMQEVFRLIQEAKESILFLLFNPGSPSIIDAIRDTATDRQSSQSRLFVRGAVSDAKVASSVTTNIFSYDILKAPDTYYFDRVTGVAAIPGPFSYFEDELLKLGFATIHDKILVIDPLLDECTAILGSHNLGFTASYKNDENMLIIQNDKAIVQAYAVHVLDLVNHFKWRYKLQKKISDAKVKTRVEKEKILKRDWNDLDETDTWMDYYFNEDGFINRDKFLF